MRKNNDHVFDREFKLDLCENSNWTYLKNVAQ